MQITNMTLVFYQILPCEQKIGRKNENIIKTGKTYTLENFTLASLQYEYLTWLY